MDREEEMKRILFRANKEYGEVRAKRQEVENTTPDFADDDEKLAEYDKLWAKESALDNLIEAADNYLDCYYALTQWNDEVDLALTELGW